MRRAELVRDPDRPRAWTLLIDGFPQSHVDLDDPAHLEFEYVRRLGHLVDATPPGPLRVLHLGAGGLTLARYIAATRPGSDQLAVDTDADLIALVRERLPLPSSSRNRARAGTGQQQAAGGRRADGRQAGDGRDRGRIRVRIADAREVLDGVRPGTFDLVVADVFTAGQTPASLTSAEAAASAARALRETGIFAANVADGPPLTHAHAQVATTCTAFAHLCLIADPGVLRGRRFGNLVIAASRLPLPLPRLVRATAADPLPARVLDEQELARFTAGASPVTDASARPSPAPPRSLFGRN